ncbi:uncharacterized protein LOC114578987, partial [Dendrobium catenatum]|uniref:uncharacterized protein LOC114578987 n=1 Tax=Dendrobium catenatum TaxID=906689 RepID=UPI0010A01A3B
MDELNILQSDCLNSLNLDPLDSTLNANLKAINQKIADFTHMLASWTIQRAKAKWLTQGEEDLKFLYAKIRARQSSNKAVLNLASTFSSSSRQDTVNSIIDHFKTLFNPPSLAVCDVIHFPMGNCITSFMSHNISLNATTDEIKAAVFSGASSSTPGPDGYNFFFYKSGWHILGPLVCKAVRGFLSSGYMPSGVKATAIALVPKSKHTASFSDFRPIALCNVFYKIIAKVLANRLKPIMPLIIKDNQAGFIK